MKVKLEEEVAFVIFGEIAVGFVLEANEGLFEEGLVEDVLIAGVPGVALEGTFFEAGPEGPGFGLGCRVGVGCGFGSKWVVKWGGVKVHSS